jgi:zinc transport system ATP-binding protein
MALQPTISLYQDSADSEVLIAAQNLGVNRDGRWLIKDVNLELRRGEILSVIGPNGGGKSTLINVLAGITESTTGEVKQAEDLVLGYVPQQFTLPKSLPMRVKDFLNQTRCLLTDSRLEQLIDELGLGELQDRSMHALSGGERQRVLLARALKQNPGVLLLDEPMQGIDLESQQLLHQLIRSWPKDQRSAVVIVSHDIEWVMAGTEHVICINQHLCCEGVPEQLSENPVFHTLFGAPRVHYTHRHQCDHEHH